MIKRQGGLVFWRVGRLGGSFYWAKAKPKVERETDWVAAYTLASCAVLSWMMVWMMR